MKGIGVTVITRAHGYFGAGVVVAGLNRRETIERALSACDDGDARLLRLRLADALEGRILSGVVSTPDAIFSWYECEVV